MQPVLIGRNACLVWVGFIVYGLKKDWLQDHHYGVSGILPKRNDKYIYPEDLKILEHFNHRGFLCHKTNSSLFIFLVLNSHILISFSTLPEHLSTFLCHILHMIASNTPNNGEWLFIFLVKS